MSTRNIHSRTKSRTVHRIDHQDTETSDSTILTNWVNKRRVPINDEASCQVSNDFQSYVNRDSCISARRFVFENINNIKSNREVKLLSKLIFVFVKLTVLVDFM